MHEPALSLMITPAETLFPGYLDAVVLWTATDEATGDVIILDRLELSAVDYPQWSNMSHLELARVLLTSTVNAFNTAAKHADAVAERRRADGDTPTIVDNWPMK